LLSVWPMQEKVREWMTAFCKVSTMRATHGKQYS
jgi:hypothetical protein